MWSGYNDEDNGGGDFDGAASGFTRDDPLLGDLDGGMNDEDNDTSDASYKHLKDSIIFLIDAQSSMFDQVVLKDHISNSQQQQTTSNAIGNNSNNNNQIIDNDDKNKVFDSIPFYITLNAVANSYSEKIISSPNDVLGVVFYNCKEKQNQFDFSNIYVCQDLDIPDAKRIKQIESLIHSKSITSTINVQSNTLHEALWTCQHLFSLSNANSKLGFKRIFLFTNDDNPHRDDQSSKLKTIERGRDLMNSEIEIQLFSLKIPANTFKFDLIWKQLIHVSDDDYTGRIQYDCLENGLKELKDKIRKREFKKRGITSIPFIIGDINNNNGSGSNSSNNNSIILNCTLYSCISKTRKPAAVHLHSDTNKLLKCETKFICQDTGTELMRNGNNILQNELSSSTTTTTTTNNNNNTTSSSTNEFTNSSSSSSNDMIYYYEYGGHKSEFTLEELTNIKQLKNVSGVKNEHVQPGIKLIGFKPKSRLKIYHNYKSSGFLYPNDSKINGSLLTLSALHKKMIEMNRIAICRFIQREGTMPQFIALLPQEELIDEESNTQITPPGFQIIYLPYADGIRKLQEFTNEQTPTDKHIQLAKKITKKLTIDFNPHEFTNPSLQQFYQSLQALALEHSNIEQIEDVLKPDKEGMKKYENLMNEFKDMIFPSDYDPDSKKLTKSTTRTSSKVKKEEEEATTAAADSQDVSESTSKKKTVTRKKTNDSKKRKKAEESEEEEEKKPKKKKAELSESDEEEEEIDMVQLIKDGKADKLKVDILKEFCKQYKLKVSGSKKDLIERITEFLKKKKKI